MLDTTIKYLGEFEIDYQATEDRDGELAPGINYHNGFLSLDSFMRVNNPTIFYHGIMGLTNTSAYAVKLDDSNDSVKLFLLY